MMAEYTDHQKLMRKQKERSEYYKSEIVKNWAIAGVLIASIFVIVLVATTTCYYLDGKGVTSYGNYNTQNGNAYIHMSSISKEETKNA